MRCTAGQIHRARWALCFWSNRQSPWWSRRTERNERPNPSTSWRVPLLSSTSLVCPPWFWCENKKVITKTNSPAYNASLMMRVVRNGSPVNWEFRVHISNFIGEVNQAFHGRQAQVPSLRRWVLIQHNRRLRHISDVDPPCVDSVQLKLLAWLIKLLIFTLQERPAPCVHCRFAVQMWCCKSVND